MNKNLKISKSKIKSNNGITLVSLVITIVIMLILAGVSINLIIGNGGLFNKSKTSAETYSKASIQEELQTVSNGIYLNDSNDPITNKKIAEYMSNELSDLTWRSKDLLAGVYKGYDFYIDENKNVKMEKIDVPDPAYILNTSSYNENTASCFTKYAPKIKTVTIKIDDNPTYPSTAIAGMKWDVSDTNQTKAGTVISYLESTTDPDALYNLTIVAKSKIIMPQDSSRFFYAFSRTESITGFENLDTSNVTNMKEMFYNFGTDTLVNLDLGSFDTSNVENMESMFYNCGGSKMESLKLGTKFNTSNCTNMKYMFYMCGQNKMQSLNLGSNFNTQKVNNFTYMFAQCGQYALKTLSLGNGFDIKSATAMQGIFCDLGVSTMTDLDLGKNFIIPAAITNRADMFYCVGISSCTIHCLSSQVNTIKGLCSPSRTNIDGKY